MEHMVVALQAAVLWKSRQGEYNMSYVSPEQCDHTRMPRLQPSTDYAH